MSPLLITFFRNVAGDLLSPTKELVALDGDEEGRKSLESEKPLSERLKIRRGEELDLIPPQLLRKYIAYARKYVHPQLSVESARVLQVRIILILAVLDPLLF